jgi:hypothetical protein
VHDESIVLTFSQPINVPFTLRRSGRSAQYVPPRETVIAFRETVIAPQLHLMAVVDAQLGRGRDYEIASFPRSHWR